MSVQSKSLPAASERRLEADLRVLAEDIGVRLAGSAGEQAAVRHLSRQLGQTGAQVRGERFAMVELADGEELPLTCSEAGSRRNGISAAGCSPPRALRPAQPDYFPPALIFSRREIYSNGCLEAGAEEGT